MVTTSSGGGLPSFTRLRLERSGIVVREILLRDSRFEFSNLEEGRYTLVAEAPGYDAAVQRDILPGEVQVLELRRRPEAAAAAPGAPDAVWDLRIPEAARRQFEAGRNKLVNGKCGDALDHLRKAIRAYAGYGDAHRALGECLARMDRPAAAEEEFKEALQQPHLPEVHLLLAKIYAARGNEALVLRQFEFYVSEEKPGALRDRIQAILAGPR
jgi:tetratricopeptide (TPR) repeat protein